MRKTSVTCAIIESNQKVLVTQRSEKMKLPLKWEFPGGKVEKGETDEDCLIREIYEELNINIVIKKKLKSNTHNYSENNAIELIPFLCEIKDGEIKLTEHTNFLWLSKSELLNLDWAEADVPILNEYLKIRND
jgi:8-oxo-dGTP diphosphatase